MFRAYGVFFMGDDAFRTDIVDFDHIYNIKKPSEALQKFISSQSLPGNILGFH